jgi:bacillithiol biosynthesis deacetylase BshB1
VSPRIDGAETVDVLAVGAHPDDVELGCGGTLALLARQGRRVGIVHLTRGEAGSRGTPAVRRREAERAAETLGAAALEILDCGDGSLRTGPHEEDELIAVLRRLRPELVLGPPPVDRHPDHGRAHRLLAAACYYAGLAARGPRVSQSPPHRPGAVFSFMQHDSFEPDFVVDVSAAWETKLEALGCYESQLHRPGEGEGGDGEQHGPPTKIASREFALTIEGRARHWGLLIGAEYGEPFGSRLPLAVADPLALVPGGLR